ncbi:hypothetical protein [Paenibacillus sp. FSL K6-2524]
MIRLPRYVHAVDKLAPYHILCVERAKDPVKALGEELAEVVAK